MFSVSEIITCSIISNVLFKFISLGKSVRNSTNPAVFHTAIIKAILMLAITLISALPAAANAQEQQPITLSKTQIQTMQQSLQLLGYDAGDADGVVGARTVSAIGQFQNENGLTVTGKPDESLYDALIAAINRTTTAAGDSLGSNDREPMAAAQATQQKVNELPGSPPPVSDLSQSAWLFVNEDNSRQTLRLSADGSVQGVDNPNFWKWRIEGTLIIVEYDNRLGGWVRRTGRFANPNLINGEAESSRKQRWEWIARRAE